MNIDKTKILNNICYTELVYNRINKKLKSNLTKSEIETMLFDIINETREKFFQKIGKNFYISNTENNIRITINSYTYRIITVDRITKIENKLIKDK
ncbi:DUF3781 domain-containing protein [Flavobacterium hydatis]|uniref:DUF3781 domain-containing protein n=1 Tax=Flavobacterium hydatis TaxID=991 RepID=A0A086A387_FLAHY|nr:DUF3781 domain-containing protein [Flavobacterium hydatis]KFF11151.1 hypothetical protein IW20_19600 [Flavobacterium hydatis]